jgi:hypothetical protein
MGTINPYPNLAAVDDVIYDFVAIGGKTYEDAAVAVGDSVT